MPMPEASNHHCAYMHHRHVATAPMYAPSHQACCEGAMSLPRPRHRRQALCPRGRHRGAEVGRASWQAGCSHPVRLRARRLRHTSPCQRRQAQLPSRVPHNRGSGSTGAARKQGETGQDEARDAAGAARPTRADTPCCPGAASAELPSWGSDCPRSRTHCRTAASAPTAPTAAVTPATAHTSSHRNTAH